MKQDTRTRRGAATIIGAAIASVGLLLAGCNDSTSSGQPPRVLTRTVSAPVTVTTTVTPEQAEAGNGGAAGVSATATVTDRVTVTRGSGTATSTVTSTTRVTTTEISTVQGASGPVDSVCLSKAPGVLVAFPPNNWTQLARSLVDCDSSDAAVRIIDIGDSCPNDDGTPWCASIRVNGTRYALNSQARAGVCFPAYNPHKDGTGTIVGWPGFWSSCTQFTWAGKDSSDAKRDAANSLDLSASQVYPVVYRIMSLESSDSACGPNEESWSNVNYDGHHYTLCLSVNDN